MIQRGALFWSVICAAAAILTYQLFLPPVIGLADQGDFRRMIGRFGYGPERVVNVAYVAPKYVPSPNFRAPEWEQVSSEYLFVASALLLNKVISKDGRLDITVMGFVHVLAFLAVFARFLFVTRDLPARTLVWIGALIILTDVGYAAYWNSFYAEPASCLFCLLLLTESIDICNKGSVSRAAFVRWTLWAALFLLAKPQNAPLALPFMIFAVRLRSPAVGWIAIAAGAAVILAAAVTNFVTAPVELKNACTYNMVFQAILPEGKDPPADLAALGMDPKLRVHRGTGAWSPNTVYPALEADGVIGTSVTHATVVRFYLSRPARLWRHIRSILPVATSLRPEMCGNFEPSSGLIPGARSDAVALWSAFHRQALSRVVRFILFLLLIPPLIAAARPLRKLPSNLWFDFAALLAVSCLLAFLTAAFGDAWDNVKHMFLFNLLLDACLIFTAASLWRSIPHLTSKMRNR